MERKKKEKKKEEERKQVTEQLSNIDSSKYLNG